MAQKIKDRMNLHQSKESSHQIKIPPTIARHLVLVESLAITSFKRRINFHGGKAGKKSAAVNVSVIFLLHS